MKKISMIIPCYNEQESVPLYYEKATEFFKDIEYDYEFIFINDGSRDNTYDILKGLAEKDEKVKVISFSRNFGQQAGMMAGYRNATGDAAIEMDVDLQDPLYVIPDLIKKWEEGYHIIHAKRKRRAGETFFKKFTAKMYYKVLHKISKVQVPRDTGDFKLYDRAALDVMINMPEKVKSIKNLAAWVGFKQTYVEYDRESRTAGETKYNIRSLFKLARTSIVSFSDYPLSISMKMGISTIILSALAYITFIVLAICGISLSLTAWLFPTIAIFAGMIFVNNGLTNMYISEIYDEVRERPDYIIENTINIDKK